MERRSLIETMACVPIICSLTRASMRAFAASNLSPATAMGPSSGNMMRPSRLTTSDCRLLVLPISCTSKRSPGPTTYSDGKGISLTGAYVEGTPANKSYPNGRSASTSSFSSGSSVNFASKAASAGSRFRRALACFSVRPARGMGATPGSRNTPLTSSL